MILDTVSDYSDDFMIRLSAFPLLILLLTLPANAQDSGFLIGTGTTGIGFGDIPRVIIAFGLLRTFARNLSR